MVALEQRHGGEILKAADRMGEVVFPVVEGDEVVDTGGLGDARVDQDRRDESGPGSSARG